MMVVPMVVTPDGISFGLIQQGIQLTHSIVQEEQKPEVVEMRKIASLPSYTF